MAGYRPRAYYKELKKIPNVKLMNPNLSSFGLIQKAKLITTITGTVGWEAVQLKKPVITFGDIFYNKLSMVKRCRTIDRLPYLVQEQLYNFHYNEEEMINYLSAMIEDSIEVPIITMWEKDFNNTEKIRAQSRPIADLIAKKLNLLSKTKK